MTRVMCGLLVTLSLNMLVLPCAMAFGLDDHDCAHCPTAEQSEMAGHHHGQENEAAASCADAMSQCCAIADANVDSRASKLKLRDAGDMDIAPVADPGIGPAIAVIPIESAPRPPDPPDTFPLLHVLFCVYLD